MTKSWENNPFEQSPKLWQISFHCKEADIAAFEELFEDKALAFSTSPRENSWHVEIIVDEFYDCQSLRAKRDNLPPIQNLEIKLLEDKDWLSEVASDIQDVQTLLFHITRNQSEKDRLIPIIINNPRAFGMGDHETTIGCIKSIEYIHEKLNFKPKDIMDIGTGTGILAIAAKKLWNSANVYGVDIDKEAVKISIEHAKLNDVDIEFDMDIQKYKEKKFDLIMANILANPLIEMSDLIVSMLNHNGILVISGFTSSQSKKLEGIYKKLSLEIINIELESDWAIVILQKKLAQTPLSS